MFSKNQNKSSKLAPRNNKDEAFSLPMILRGDWDEFTPVILVVLTTKKHKV